MMPWRTWLRRSLGLPRAPPYTISIVIAPPEPFSTSDLKSSYMPLTGSAPGKSFLSMRPALISAAGAWTANAAASVAAAAMVVAFFSMCVIVCLLSGFSNRNGSLPSRQPDLQCRLTVAPLDS